MESERDSRDESDLGVLRFDATIGESEFDGGESLGAVFDDSALKLHERPIPIWSGPGHLRVEGFTGLIVGKFEVDAQTFFAVGGALERRVGLDDPGEHGARSGSPGSSRVRSASALWVRGCITTGPTSTSFGLVALGVLSSVVPGSPTHFVGVPVAQRITDRSSLPGLSPNESETPDSRHPLVSSGMPLTKQ